MNFLSFVRIAPSVSTSFLFSIFMVSAVAEANAGQAIASSEQLSRLVSVQGSGVIDAQADQGLLTIQVVARDTNMQVAKQQIDKQSQQLTEYLLKQKIKRADISNAMTRIRHEFKTDEQQLPTFVAEREIKILFRNLADYPEFLEYAVSQGNLEIQPIALMHANAQLLYNQALQLALENAKAKAEILAKQSQTKLGKVIVVREQSQAPRPMAAMTMRADYAVEIGTQGVNAEVSVEFQLLEH